MLRSIHLTVFLLCLVGEVNSLSCPDSPNPAGTATCAEQKKYGKCAKDFMVGWCCRTCHNCTSGCGAYPPPPPPGPPIAPSPPADPKASAQATQLLATLHSVSLSDAFIFGHHNTNFEGQHWVDRNGALGRSDVALATNGSLAGMYGFNLDWVAQDTTNVTALVTKMHEAAPNAVLHMFWQATNPVTGKSANDLNGNPIAQLMPGGSANAVWLQWLDKIAVFFLEVESLGVPALFRPFHENTGGWFWWGVKSATPAQYKAAWNYTVAVLQSKGVHSLLYAYAPSKPSQTSASWAQAYGHGAESYYPGDSLVDIACFDHYGHLDFHEILIIDCESVTRFALSRGKLPAICEFGVTEGINKLPANDPATALWYKNAFLDPVLASSTCSRIAFAHTWRNAHQAIQYHVPLPQNASYPGFVEFFNSNHTIFADDPRLTTH
jgi:hypothetical protein